MDYKYLAKINNDAFNSHDMHSYLMILSPDDREEREDLLKNKQFSEFQDDFQGFLDNRKYERERAYRRNNGY